MTDRRPAFRTDRFESAGFAWPGLDVGEVDAAELGDRATSALHYPDQTVRVLEALRVEIAYPFAGVPE